MLGQQQQRFSGTAPEVRIGSRIANQLKSESRLVLLVDFQLKLAVRQWMGAVRRPEICHHLVCFWLSARD